MKNPLHVVVRDDVHVAGGGADTLAHQDAVTRVPRWGRGRRERAAQEVRGHPGVPLEAAAREHHRSRAELAGLAAMRGAHARDALAVVEREGGTGKQFARAAPQEPEPVLPETVW